MLVQGNYVREEFGEVTVEKRDDEVRVYLPHSCDEWVIGDAEDVQEMISNLQKALAFMKTL